MMNSKAAYILLELAQIYYVDTRNQKAYKKWRKKHRRRR